MGKLNSAGFLTGTAAVDGDFNVFSAAARETGGGLLWVLLVSTDSRAFVLLVCCKVSISRYSDRLSC